jgi:hypothetical protein
MPHCGKEQGKLCRTCEKDFASAKVILGNSKVFISETGR